MVRYILVGMALQAFATALLMATGQIAPSPGQQITMGWLYLAVWAVVPILAHRGHRQDREDNGEK